MTKFKYPKSTRKQKSMSYSETMNKKFKLYKIVNSSNPNYISIDRKNGKQIFFVQDENADAIRKESNPNGNPTNKEIFEFVESAGALQV